MTFTLLFIVFLVLLIAFYMTYRIGFIVGINHGIELTDKTIDYEIEKRWKKINENRPDKR